MGTSYCGRRCRHCEYESPDYVHWKDCGMLRSVRVCVSYDSKAILIGQTNETSLKISFTYQLYSDFFFSLEISESA